jgi:hypothetical protein
MFGPKQDNQFEARFRLMYEREMTPDELKYLSLAESALGEQGSAVPIIQLVPKAA